MKERYLSGPVESLCFARRHKIALVSGPRQCGKTTMARMLLASRAVGRCYNWDEYEFRHTWGKGPSAVIPPRQGSEVPLIVLDEIHKDRLWKRNLKGLYDTLERPCDFLVTGSAGSTCTDAAVTAFWAGIFISGSTHSAYARLRTHRSCRRMRPWRHCGAGR